MLEAVAMLPGALRRRIVVLIAGEPPDEDQLRCVESLGMQDRVIFVGLLGMCARSWRRWTWVSCCRPAWRPFPSLAAK